MSKHLAILIGAQKERVTVICDSESEARNVEARWEANKKAERRTVEPDTEADEDTCPTCGQRKPVLDEAEDEL